MQNLIDAIVPIFIAIAVISGIINSIREAAAKNAKQQQPPVRPMPSRAQSEITDFLTGNPTPQQRPPQAAPTPQSSSRPKQNQRPKPQRASGNASGQATSQTQPKKKPQKEKGVGSGVAAHVESFIGQHVESHMARNVDAHVNKDITERVRSNLGSQSSQPVEMSSSDKGSQAADDILVLLKSPKGVRQAIIVNEILSKPLGLRPR